jgi:hypothetical protein
MTTLHLLAPPAGFFYSGRADNTELASGLDQTEKRQTGRGMPSLHGSSTAVGNLEADSPLATRDLGQS